MKTFLKLTMIVLVVAIFTSLAVEVSMYYWPGIPPVPDARQGRIYPLDNHGGYTYMNRQEYLLRGSLFWIFFVCFSAAAAIEQFLDPFDRKLRPRPLDPKLPPWKNRH
jgi:hypothetical protein